MIWDRGTWEPEVEDVDRALAKGDLKFTLHGQKLHGSWVLVRMRERQWLLIKHRDKVASTIDVTAAKPRSAVSRRTLAGIARSAGASLRQLAQAKEADASSTSPAG
jgi:bifunctional non-homologous end joining protein LigD